MSVAIAVPSQSGVVRLRHRSSATSTTTAALGRADVYRMTAASTTLTISAADILEEGRLFEVVGVNAGSGSVFVATEGSELIGGSAENLELTVNLQSVVLRTFGGNLEVRSS